MKLGIKLGAVVLAMSVAAFAQHGSHGGGAMGGGSGMGGPGMGGPAMGNPGAGMGSGAGSTHGMGVPNTTSPGSSMDRQQQSRASTTRPSPEDILNRNSQLSSNLDKLLPAGMTAQQACSGFKNLGQCVAAVHVSHNLDIPFSDLKSKVTGENSENLGKAIHSLKPDVNAKAEAKKAQHQAKEDIKQSKS